MTTKQCQDCKTKQPITNFTNRKDNGKVYKLSYCKTCMVIRARNWQKKNPEKFRAYQKKYYAK